MLFNLPIIFDKSAIQCLSGKDDYIDALTRHYLIVIPPILLVEIMSDLFKFKSAEEAERKIINTEYVQQLALKLEVNSAVKNNDFKILCEGELLGHRVTENFKPCISPTTIKDFEDGTAAYIDNTAEMNNLLRWQNGQFTDEETKSAKDYREQVSETNLNEYSSKVKGLNVPFKAPSLVDLKNQINESVSKTPIHNQWVYIDWYCHHLKIPKRTINLIQSRFREANTSFQNFAPYTYYCNLLQQVFTWGLANDLIKTSKSAKSQIDILYAFYFPFARIFCSNDNFHKVLWSVFGNHEQQIFVSGDELKTDLKRLQNHWESITEQERQKLRDFSPYPPILNDSFTYNAFERMIEVGKYPNRQDFLGNVARERTPEEERL